mgnify:CR=1 FL=1
MKLQDASKVIYEQKYQLKDLHGNQVDKDVNDTFRRVAKAVASVEVNMPVKCNICFGSGVCVKPLIAPEPPDVPCPNGCKKSEGDFDLVTFWEGQFNWALNNGLLGAGRIMANAGAEEYKPGTSLINCTVSDTMPDSMEGIFKVLNQAALTLKSGAGIGYEFSTLRPKGAMVNGVGASTSGPLSFSDIFEAMCRTISSAGGRRGAQMMTFSISHPDIEEVINVKREDGRLRKFNISILITKDFMEAVKDDADWDLYFPMSKAEDPTKVKTIAKEWPIYDKNHLYYESPEPENKREAICRVYKTVKARDLYNKIMKSTYDYGDPGFILIDEYNDKNNLWWAELIRATNPCGR